MKNPILLLVLLIFPFVSKALDPWEKSEKHAPSGNFDFNVYAVTWQPTFCMKHSSGNCENRFYVHGVWPYFHLPDDGRIRNYYPSYCYNSPGCEDKTDCELTDEQATSIMRNDAVVHLYPKNLFLFKHEWHKHGTCSGMTPENYFLQAMTYERSAFPSLKELRDFITQHESNIEISVLDITILWTVF